ncbi:hypothetical protein NQZ68_022264, partial [Dissostichus eleginoides]
MYCMPSAVVINQALEYSPIKVTQPFELVGMDLIGKLAMTKDGYLYVCVMIDYMTKWPQAYPLSAKSAEEETGALSKLIDGSVEDVVVQENVTEDILHLEDTLKEARVNVTRAQEKTRQRLKTGWRQNIRSQQRKGGKLEPNLLVPFTIQSLQGNSADLQGGKGALIHKVKPASSPASHAPGPAAATPTQVCTVPDKIVKDAWAGNDSHVMVSKIGAYKLYYWDIKHIGPNMELESEVIIAYLAVKVKAFNNENPSGQRATFIDSFEMTNIWNRKKSRLRIDPLTYDVILGIVNDHHHWTLT